MKILILSPDKMNGDCEKFCLIGISFSEITFGVIVDFDW